MTDLKIVYLPRNKMGGLRGSTRAESEADIVLTRDAHGALVIIKDRFGSED